MSHRADGDDSDDVAEFMAKPKEGKRKHLGRTGSQLKRTVAKDIEVK